jgi:hypothetical protein
MHRIGVDHLAIGIPRMADAPAVLVGSLGDVPVDGGDGIRRIVCS